MQDFPDDSTQTKAFRRDMTAFFAILGCVIGGLWGFGAVNAVNAGIALLVGLVLILVYSASVKGRVKPQATSGQAAPSSVETIKPVDTARAVLQALNQPALIVHNGAIQVCNTAARRIFNLPEYQIDLSVASLRNPTLLQAIEKVLNHGGQAQCELQPARNLDEFWLTEVTALGGEPREKGVLLVLTDQKPVRLAQQARADFLANASHELRTPLTSISGFIETMKGPAKDDLAVWPRFIDIMDEQTRHMRVLIGELLSLSRIELSEHLLPDTRLDLALAAKEALEALQPLAAARDLRLQILGDEAPLMILGDDGEIKQVIRNLISNAIKYAPDESEITLTLGTAPSLIDAQKQAARSWVGAGRMTLLNPQNRRGPAIWMQVRDNGPGIAPQHLPRLGERFFRVDDSRGGPIEGTGLGLAIVKHIMARHRGGLAVESLSGQGAAFSVWFAAASA